MREIIDGGGDLGIARDDVCELKYLCVRIADISTYYLISSWILVWSLQVVRAIMERTRAIHQESNGPRITECSENES